MLTEPLIERVVHRIFDASTENGFMHFVIATATKSFSVLAPKIQLRAHSINVFVDIFLCNYLF